MRIVNLIVTVRNDGTATIEIPHDKNQAKNAAAAAKFTDNLSKAIGEVLERHIGDHDHHDHEHLPNHVTLGEE